MVILLFSLFIIYTTACCMDGPDLKPKWKYWLGSKLESMAVEFKPINYCRYHKCRFYRKSEYDLPALREQYESLLQNITECNLTNSRPTIFVSQYNIKKIEHVFRLVESELFDARIQEHIADERGISLFQLPQTLTVDGLVNRAKSDCMRSVIDAVKPFVVIEEDRKSDYPNIIIRGTLYIGTKNKNDNNLLHNTSLFK